MKFNQHFDDQSSHSCWRILFIDYLINIWFWWLWYFLCKSNVSSDKPKLSFVNHKKLTPYQYIFTEFLAETFTKSSFRFKQVSFWIFLLCLLILPGLWWPCLLNVAKNMAVLWRTFSSSSSMMAWRFEVCGF